MIHVITVCVWIYSVSEKYILCYYWLLISKLLIITHQSSESEKGLSSSDTESAGIMTAHSGLILRRFYNLAHWNTFSAGQFQLIVRLQMRLQRFFCFGNLTFASVNNIVKIFHSCWILTKSIRGKMWRASGLTTGSFFSFQSSSVPLTFSFSPASESK